MSHGEFLDLYRRAAGIPPHQELSIGVDRFGDSPELAATLCRLILAGTKTATCSSLWAWQHEGEALPLEGDCKIVCDAENQPQCIIRIDRVYQQAYSQVPSEFAWAEGEGDRSLAYWRQEHQRFFARTLPAIGRQFDPEMPLVCEHFSVIFRHP